MGHEASAYYSMLLNNSDCNSSSLKLTWEADFNMSFTDEEWSLILRNMKKMSRELKTRLIQFKILHRVYWTPSRLHRVGLRDDAGCWRCNDEEGTLVHMLWGCPAVQEFWRNVRDYIQTILTVDIPFAPTLYVLGHPAALEELSPYDAEWVQTVLMLGRKLIVMKWKDPIAPTAAQWFIQLGKLAALEKLTFRLLNKVEVYLFKWERYLRYLGEGD